MHGMADAVHGHARTAGPQQALVALATTRVHIRGGHEQHAPPEKAAASAALVHRFAPVPRGRRQRPVRWPCGSAQKSACDHRKPSERALRAQRRPTHARTRAGPCHTRVDVAQAAGPFIEGLVQKSSSTRRVGDEPRMKDPASPRASTPHRSPAYVRMCRALPVPRTVGTGGRPFARGTGSEALFATAHAAHNNVRARRVKVGHGNDGAAQRLDRWLRPGPPQSPASAAPPPFPQRSAARRNAGQRRTRREPYRA